jgi:hypothetical protein
MLTERLQEKAAVDGTCADFNKQMLGQGPQGELKCRSCRDEMVGVAPVMDEVRSLQTLQEVTLLKLFSDRKLL